MASQAKSESTSSTPPEEQSPVQQQTVKWHVYVEAEDGQVFTCGIYDTVTEDDAISLGKQRAKKDNYEAEIAIKRYFAERTTG
jgi:hypothetical protein